MHHISNDPGQISEWNKTNCSMYEIDPFDEKENKTGFKIEDCSALEKFKRLGW